MIETSSVLRDSVARDSLRCRQSRNCRANVIHIFYECHVLLFLSNHDSTEHHLNYRLLYFLRSIYVLLCFIMYDLREKNSWFMLKMISNFLYIDIIVIFFVSSVISILCVNECFHLQISNSQSYLEKNIFW